MSTQLPESICSDGSIAVQAHTRPKNPYGKTRKEGDPWAIYTDPRMPGWIWKILKLNQAPEKAKTNKYASAFCAVSSPHTYGSSDFGDTYLDDIGKVRLCGANILQECGR